MDLVAGVRKEGSRGGRADFKWSDVADSQHRENYLGHSLMAPVGRWQKNRDLGWYAKNEDSSSSRSQADAAKEEIRRIKEAEQDALSEALGYPVLPRVPQETAGVGARDIERAMGEVAGEEEGEGDGVRGVGFGGRGGGGGREEGEEILEGEMQGRGGLEGRDRKRSRSREERDRYRRSDHGREREKRRYRSRERSLERRRRRDERRGGRSRSPERRRRRDRSRDRGYSRR